MLNSFTRTNSVDSQKKARFGIKQRAFETVNSKRGLWSLVSQEVRIYKTKDPRREKEY